MASRARPSIMVIGFDADFCYLMQRFGRISAHPLILARQDEDILAQVCENQPEVIFLEIVHPGRFAWTLFTQLKSHPKTRSIPIIICSWQEEEPQDGQENADYYLRLPILYEHFTAALEHIGG